MTVPDINKLRPSKKDYSELCSWNIFSIIKFAHPNVTAIDIVRTGAQKPSQISLLKNASPNDMAVALKWNVKKACKSKTIKDLLDEAWRAVYIRSNNDTLRKFGKRLNLTINEMTFFLQRTLFSLLLMRRINFGDLQRGINQGRLVEEKVSRLAELVTFLKTLQPGTRFNEYELKQIVRNYPYKIAKNLTDESLRHIISTNNIDVFTKYIQLKNLGVFYGNLSLDYLKELRLSDVIVDLIGIELNDFKRQFSYLNFEDSVQNKIGEVEIHWDISTGSLTLEKLLIASRLMDGKVLFYISLE